MLPGYKYRPGIYYLLTFLITYVLWFAGAYVSYQPDGDELYMLLMLPGLMTPFLLSLIIIFRSGNADLKKDFVNRLVNIRLIEPKVLPVFIFIMPLLILVSISISLLFGGSMSQFGFAEGFSFSSGFVPVLLLLLLAAGFEELGWRGYAFDSLQSRYTYFTASLIFGILWSLWHFPLVFVNNSYQYEIIRESIWYGVNFFVSIVPMGMLISWICIKNRKSIIAAIVFHFIVNLSQEILDISQTTKCIETGVLIIAVAAIIVYDREMFFSREHLQAERESPTH
jgi:membrane protease YdiL (CAAX protease family)